YFAHPRGFDDRERPQPVGRLRQSAQGRGAQHDPDRGTADRARPDPAQARSRLTKAGTNRSKKAALAGGLFRNGFDWAGVMPGWAGCGFAAGGSAGAGGGFSGAGAAGAAGAVASGAGGAGLTGGTTCSVWLPGVAVILESTSLVGPEKAMKPITRSAAMTAATARPVRPPRRVSTLFTTCGSP